MVFSSSYLVLPAIIVIGGITINAFGASLQRGEAPWHVFIFLSCIIGSILLWKLFL